MKTMRILGLVCAVAVAGGMMCAQENARPDLKVKTKSNIKNDRGAAPQAGTPGTVTPAPTPVDAAKIKSHSNSTNNREAQPDTGAAGATADKPKAPVPKKHVSNIKWSARTAPSTSGTGTDAPPTTATPKASTESKAATKRR